MPLRHDAFFRLEFWASCYTRACNPEDLEEACRHLGVEWEAMTAWWDEFTGYHPAFYDDKDCSEDPATLCLTSGPAKLFVHVDPADLYYAVQGPGAGQAISLGNIGPHYLLPALRWEEAVQIARRSKGCPSPSAKVRQAFHLLLLLPVVWLVEGDDEQEAIRSSARAWVGSGLVDAEAAWAMARLWCDSVSHKEFEWWRDAELGWVTSAPHSRRCRDGHTPRQEIIAANRLLEQMQGLE